MRTLLTPIGLGLLLVVLLWYRRRLRVPLGIRYLRLPMWYPEPTRTCISYSITRQVTFIWMTCVSLPPAAVARRRRRQLGHRVAALSTEASTPTIPHRPIACSAAVFRRRVQRLRHVQSLVMDCHAITIRTRSPILLARLSA